MKLALALAAVAALAVPSSPRACEVPGPCQVVDLCDGPDCDAPAYRAPPYPSPAAPPPTRCDAPDCESPAKVPCDAPGCDAPDVKNAAVPVDPRK
jgi:hypothetical protein